LDLGEGLEAVHAVHPDVEEGQIGQLVGEKPHGVGAAADRRDPIPFVLQHVAQGRPDGRLVVDYQDMLAGHVTLLVVPQAQARSVCRSFYDASTGAAVRDTGSSMTKRVPVGSLSSTRIVPPCSVTISCTIGSPSPMPETLVEK